MQKLFLSSDIKKFVNKNEKFLHKNFITYRIYGRKLDQILIIGLVLWYLQLFMSRLRTVCSTTSIVSTKTIVITLTLSWDLVSIGIERWQQEYFSVVEQSCHCLISSIVGDQVPRQIYQHLSPHHLITMHVANIFKHWLHQTSSLNIVTQLDVCQRSSLYRLSNRANLQVDSIAISYFNIKQLSHWSTFLQPIWFASRQVFARFIVHNKSD